MLNHCAGIVLKAYRYKMIFAGTRRTMLYEHNSMAFKHAATNALSVSVCIKLLHKYASFFKHTNLLKLAIFIFRYNQQKTCVLLFIFSCSKTRVLYFRTILAKTFVIFTIINSSKKHASFSS